jgi:hypothetical protein
MKLAIKGTSLFAALMLVCAGAAFSVDQEPVLGFAGSVEAGPVSVSKAQQQPQPRIDATSVVYDNTASPALFAVSSTDLASVWGDRVNTVGVGVLNEHVFSVFNSGSSSGPLLTAVIRIDFFDGVTALPIGAYTTNVNFGAGLQPGFYSLVTVSNLDPLVIILAVQDVIVTQTIQSFTGGNRFGIDARRRSQDWKRTQKIDRLETSAEGRKTGSN